MYQDFFDSIRNRLRKTVRTTKNSADRRRFDTSDIVQNSCLQIWQDLARHDGSISEVKSSWLQKIAIGHTCKMYRTHSAAKRTSSREDEGHPVATVVDDRNTSAAEEVEKRDLTLRLFECLSNIGKLKRQIIFKRFFGDQTFDQIADELGLTRYQVHKSYEAALSTLQVELSK